MPSTCSFFGPFARAAGVLALAAFLVPAVAVAAPSESGSSGVWDVPSAESKRAGRLGLGFFGRYRNLDLRDSLSTHLNHLTLGGSASFGIPGGFELSGALPIHGYYTSTDEGSSPFDESFKLRLGDVTGRLRWTTSLGGGLRWGWEGEATLPTGTDDEMTFPSRGTVKPFTAGKNNYVARSMLTWDARGGGRSLALRIHAGAGYHFQGDEGRYYNANATLPLDLPTPTDDKQNDFLSLFTAAELDLARVTLFGELSTDQYVNQRSLLRSKESRTTLTPGIRFWLPGGLSLVGAYSINLAEDDPATTFNPDLAFSDNQLRVGLSLGTVYRNKRAVREEAEAAPMPMPPAAATDPVVAERAQRDAEIRARHETQDDVRADPNVAPAPKPPAAKSAPMAPRYVDTDGDGIPDAQDQCPLMAEDWDGFQDYDGCPDLDNDRDGILDVNDQCPNDPETYNGYYDFDGCPDEVPADRNRVGASVAPAPAAPTVNLQTQLALEAERRRSFELESRIRALESANRTPVVVERSGSTPTPMPIPVVLNSGNASLTREYVARLAELEAEMSALRARVTQESAGAATLQPADTTGKRILNRLAAIQASMDSMAVAQSEAHRAGRAQPAVEARKKLDTMLPVGSTRVFPEVQFDSGSAWLQAGAMPILERLAGALRLVPDAHVEVVGHTDDVGRSGANLVLSQERARAVADALVQRGVSPMQLTVLGRGETMRVASNATDAGRQANRRVEFSRSH